MPSIHCPILAFKGRCPALCLARSQQRRLTVGQFMLVVPACQSALALSDTPWYIHHSRCQVCSQVCSHTHQSCWSPLPLSWLHLFAHLCGPGQKQYPCIADSTAETVAQAFVTTWVAHFVTPTIIMTDRGGQHLWGSLHSTKHICTTAYHPCANGFNHW